MSTLETDDITVSDLTVSYETLNGPLCVLDRVSFSVKRGQMCCIVGPSGCGKSTLLRAILKLVDKDSGSIRIDPKREKEGIAFVQQDCPLLPWRTALQNACLGVEIYNENKTTISKFDEVGVGRVRRRLGAEFGLRGFEDSLTAELSGGMRQRVSIARALESSPALLFCDEPFSAVDFVGRLNLTSRFKYLCSWEKITTVFVTHNIEEAIFLGDIVLVMTGRPGRIKNTYCPQHRSVNAAECRESTESTALFQKIWDDLRENHE